MHGVCTIRILRSGVARAKQEAVYGAEVWNKPAAAATVGFEGKTQDAITHANKPDKLQATKIPPSTQPADDDFVPPQSSLHPF